MFLFSGIRRVYSAAIDDRLCHVRLRVSEYVSMRFPMRGHKTHTSNNRTHGRTGLSIRRLSSHVDVEAGRRRSTDLIRHFRRLEHVG